MVLNLKKIVMKMFRQILALTAIVASCKALPKFETEDKGFVPSKGDFFETNGDQLAMESRPGNQTADATGERPARYGFPTYSTDVQVSSRKLKKEKKIFCSFVFCRIILRT